MYGICVWLCLHSHWVLENSCSIHKKESKIKCQIERRKKRKQICYFDRIFVIKVNRIKPAKHAREERDEAKKKKKREKIEEYSFSGSAYIFIPCESTSAVGRFSNAYIAAPSLPPPPLPPPSPPPPPSVCARATFCHIFFCTPIVISCSSFFTLCLFHTQSLCAVTNQSERARERKRETRSAAAFSSSLLQQITFDYRCLFSFAIFLWNVNIFENRIRQQIFNTKSSKCQKNVIDLRVWYFHIYVNYWCKKKKKKKTNEICCRCTDVKLKRKKRLTNKHDTHHWIGNDRETTKISLKVRIMTDLVRSN